MYMYIMYLQYVCMYVCVCMYIYYIIIIPWYPHLIPIITWPHLQGQTNFCPAGHGRSVETNQS